MFNTEQLQHLKHYYSTCDWHVVEMFSLSSPLKDWLAETGSMTKRFEQCCSKVTVKPLFEGFVTAEQLGSQVQELPESRHYWLREIILYGDSMPWLWATTVIPEQTLTDDDRQLMALNNTPLGHYLFNSGRLTRDYLQLAQCGNLWGRRSRLRLSNKPLLLTEVFLPLAPLY